MSNHIDKRNADPEVLKAYRDARNERRASSYLWPMALGGKGVFFLTFIMVMLVDISGFARLYIVLSVTGVYLLTCFTLMVAWSQSGKRLRTLGVIVGFLGVIAALVGMMTWLTSLMFAS